MSVKTLTLTPNMQGCNNPYLRRAQLNYAKSGEVTVALQVTSAPFQLPLGWEVQVREPVWCESKPFIKIMQQPNTYRILEMYAPRNTGTAE